MVKKNWLWLKVYLRRLFFIGYHSTVYPQTGDKIMGVGFSNCKASWSYTGFHNFRSKLAGSVGIDLDSSDAGKLVKQLDDDIKFLLNHSDCDGSLTYIECSKLIPRLIDLTKDWDNDDYDTEQANLLIEGMAYCVREEVDLEFR